MKNGIKYGFGLIFLLGLMSRAHGDNLKIDRNTRITPRLERALETQMMTMPVTGGVVGTPVPGWSHVIVPPTPATYNPYAMQMLQQQQLQQTQQQQQPNPMASMLPGLLQGLSGMGGGARPVANTAPNYQPASYGGGGSSPTGDNNPGGLPGNITPLAGGCGTKIEFNCNTFRVSFIRADGTRVTRPMDCGANTGRVASGKIVGPSLGQGTFYASMKNAPIVTLDPPPGYGEVVHNMPPQISRTSQTAEPKGIQEGAGCIVVGVQELKLLGQCKGTPFEVIKGNYAGDQAWKNNKDPNAMPGANREVASSGAGQASN